MAHSVRTQCPGPLKAVIRYRDALEAAGAHLVLPGVGDRVMHQLVRTGALETLGRSNVLSAETSVGKSLQAAITHAQGLRESAG